MVAILIDRSWLSPLQIDQKATREAELKTIGLNQGLKAVIVPFSDPESAYSNSTGR